MPENIVVLLPELWLAHRTLHGVVGWVVNTVRSFPFVILLVALVLAVALLIGPSFRDEPMKRGTRPSELLRSAHAASNPAHRCPAANSTRPQVARHGVVCLLR